MKELHGSAHATVKASLPACLALLAAIERYPRWYPEVVRHAEVVERDGDGRPLRARAQLHVSHGLLTHDFTLLLAVRVEPPSAVELTRVAHGQGDREQFNVSWRLREESGTRLELALTATLSVPRMLPLGGVGDAIASGFVEAAARALTVAGDTR